MHFHKDWFKITGIHVLIVIVAIAFALLVERINKQERNILSMKKDVKEAHEGISWIKRAIEDGLTGK